MEKLIVVAVTLLMIETNLTFKVTQSDINKYIDELDPKKKVQAAFNFLSRTVDKADRENFDKVMLDSENIPKGTVVLSVFGEVFQQFDGDVAVVVKKPSDTPMG